MTRLISGVVLAAVAVAAILFLPIVLLRLLACLVAALAAHEYQRIAWLGGWMGHAGSSNAKSSGGIVAESGGPLTTGLLPVVTAALTCWIISGQAAFAGTTVLLLVFGLVAMSVLIANHGLQRAAVDAFATIYVGVPLGMLAAIQMRHGARITLLLLATVVVSDSVQYYSGRAFGRRPLAPAISPKKTIEGAIGGLIVAPAFLVLAGRTLLPGAAPVWLALAGISLVVLGICGDLFESRIKRAAHVKDSSSLIPGHGGVLDRIDALLFATPAFYVYLRTLGGTI